MENWLLGWFCSKLHQVNLELNRYNFPVIGEEEKYIALFVRIFWKLSRKFNHAVYMPVLTLAISHRLTLAAGTVGVLTSSSFTIVSVYVCVCACARGSGKEMTGREKRQRGRKNRSSVCEAESKREREREHVCARACAYQCHICGGAVAQSLTFYTWTLPAELVDMVVEEIQTAIKERHNQLDTRPCIIRFQRKSQFFFNSMPFQMVSSNYLNAYMHKHRSYT